MARILWPQLFSNSVNKQNVNSANLPEAKFTLKFQCSFSRLIYCYCHLQVCAWTPTAMNLL